MRELGLTLVPSFPDLPGEETWQLADGQWIGDGIPWLTDADRKCYDQVERAFAALAATVDPDNPWAHPSAAALDAISVAAWMRSAGATPPVVRARELAMLALAAESTERTSLLSDLRKESAAGSHGFYNYDVWECQRVAEGSATVALRMAAELGHRIRYATPVSRISVRTTECVVVTATGEHFAASAVVSAIPVGPLRDIRIDGVSAARLTSLDRQRHALAAKVVFAYKDSFWEAHGQDGAAYFETAVLGGTWVQREGIVSALVPPERWAAFLTTSPAQLEAELITEMADAFGHQALNPTAVYMRRWGVDPWTQGYITAWRPGDVMAVGPLHGTHEPPFYVCGSDQWTPGSRAAGSRGDGGTWEAVRQNAMGE